MNTITGDLFKLKTMKKIGSDYQNLAEEAPFKSGVDSLKIDFKLFGDIREKMLVNSRLALPWISVVTTLTIIGSSSEALALQRGDNNSQVKNVQSCLRRLGYFNGPVNGNFGSITENAVKRFQRANGISDIGKVGPRTQAAIQRRCGSRGGTVSANDCQRGLRSGCDGTAVRELQRNLRTLGVYNGPVTGRFRQLTRNAVVNFQRQNGINPIGVVGPQTQRAIRLGLNPRVVNPPSNRNSPGRFCDYRREIIGFGCNGDWVRQLQQRLKTLNYFSGTPTGYFGEVTRNAVVRFQQDNRLPRTGAVDSVTWGRIVNSPIVNSPTASRPTLPPSIITPGTRGSSSHNFTAKFEAVGLFLRKPYRLLR